MIENHFHQLQDYYDHEKQSYVSWEGERKLRKRYTLEYCDDQKLFDKLGTRKPSGGFWEIDDCYKSIVWEEDITETKSFDGIAIAQYLRFRFNPKILDVKLWETMLDDDEVIQERWLDFPSTFCHEFGRCVEKDLMMERDNLRKANGALAKENETLREFIKAFHAENTYREWREKEWVSVEMR